MTLYMLDTNAVSEILRNPDGAVAERFLSLSRTDVCTSVIVSAELLFGVAKKSGTGLRQRMKTVLGDMNVESFEPPADRIYAKVRAELAKRGTPITPNDYLIAAHALALNAVLVTDDRAFSRVPGLRVENWLRT